MVAGGQHAPRVRPVVAAPVMPLLTFGASFGPPPFVPVPNPPRVEVISGQLAKNYPYGVTEEEEQQQQKYADNEKQCQFNKILSEIIKNDEQ